MKTTDELLQERHTAMLEWVELWPGVTANGKDIHASVSQRATVNDCIAMSRYAAIKTHGVSPDDPFLLSDAKMLNNFIITHWAQVSKSKQEKQDD